MAAVPVVASIDSLRRERGAFPFLELPLDAVVFTIMFPH